MNIHTFVLLNTYGISHSNIAAAERAFYHDKKGEMLKQLFNHIKSALDSLYIKDSDGQLEFVTRHTEEDYASFSEEKKEGLHAITFALVRSCKLISGDRKFGMTISEDSIFEPLQQFVTFVLCENDGGDLQIREWIKEHAED